MMMMMIIIIIQPWWPGQYSAGLRAGRSGFMGVLFPAGAGNFSLHHRVQDGSGAHPTSYPLGTGALSLWVKRLGREAEHSPPPSAEVKEWVELHLHSHNTPSWHGAQLKKHRDNFTFYYYNNNNNNNNNNNLHKNSCTRDITDNKESATIWNLQTEWCDAPMFQYENYQGKENCDKRW
jgi:hypothetical protein